MNGSLNIPLNYDYSKAIGNVFKEYPGLKTFSSPNDYAVIDTNSRMNAILGKHNTGIEFQGKGEKDYSYGSDTMTLDNTDKNRIYINKDKLVGDPYEAIKLDIISHGFHQHPEYRAFNSDLRQRLVDRYGEKMVDGNGGADAYVRGYLSKSKEYQPYKDEISFLPKGYFDKLDSILKTDKSSDLQLPLPRVQAGQSSQIPFAQ